MLWGAFVAYCIFLLWALYFSRSHRQGYTAGEYISAFSNFIPFHTILHYIRIAFLDNPEFVALSLWNIAGNLLMLFPLGVLLPCLFFKLDRLWKVALVVTFTVVLIETCQFVFRVGVVDVDDLILNLSGAVIGYSLLKIPPLARALRKIDILPPERKAKSALGAEKKSKKGGATSNESF